MDLDLAVIADDGSGTNTIMVLRNDLTDGQLIFSPDDDLDAGAEPLFVLAGDVDDDGQGDLVTVNASTGARAATSQRGPTEPMEISVLRQSSASSICLGDCNNSGVVDFNDLVSMLFEFGATDPAPGCDANENGSIDFNDLVEALFLFGPCQN